MLLKWEYWRRRQLTKLVLVIRKSSATPQTKIPWLSLTWPPIINKNFYQIYRTMKLTKWLFSTQLYCCPLGLSAIFAVLSLRDETNTTHEWRTYGKRPVQRTLFSHAHERKTLCLSSAFPTTTWSKPNRISCCSQMNSHPHISHQSQVRGSL